MSSSSLILCATAIVIGYLALTRVFRMLAEKKRLTALDLAHELINDEQSPQALKDFLKNDDYLGPRAIGAWIIALATIPTFIISLIKGNEKLLLKVDASSPEIREKFTRYVDASVLSTVLRSPIAAVLVLAQITILFVVLVVSAGTILNADSGIRALFARFITKFDERHRSGKHLLGH
ncbi:hypothetical protein G6L85_11520 [Agrobacterium rhizogenes]|uniref:hypothetical protein n=1 Tax=Rhizobium rhizogenes TaxID=359 RepID=UPI0015726DDF|nr:hypothetical protein [Rhizobium rhizogenes]NTI62133.1 hypothetical protein [Rhizobium rhizogenes]